MNVESLDGEFLFGPIVPKCRINKPTSVCRKEQHVTHPLSVSELYHS